MQKWATALGKNFDPKGDDGFCAWLKDNKQLSVEKLEELNKTFSIEQLRKEYADWLEKELEILVQHNQKINQEEINQLTSSPLTDDSQEALEKVKELELKNQELQEKLNELQAKDNSYQKLREKIEQEEKELEELKNSYLTKSGNYDKEKLKKSLEKFLETQTEIVRTNSSFAASQKMEIKKKLTEKTLITIEELDNLCQLQKEITQLELKLQSDTNQKEKQLTQIINFSGGQNLLGGKNESIIQYSTIQEIPSK